MPPELTIEQILAEDSALLDGHFKLRSGMHSSNYLQCAMILQHPPHAEFVARRLSDRLSGEKVRVVVGPATGGIIVAHELARALSARSLFAERVDDAFGLRRGFHVAPGEKVVVAEDVITTGGGAKEVVALLRSMGADVVAVTSIVNRSGSNPFDCPFHFLYEIDIPAWDPSECPLCRKGVPLDKPGSRTEVKN